MKIGVISDSHDNLPALRRAIKYFMRIEVDAIIHAGDIVAPFAAKILNEPPIPRPMPVHVVYGNNDGERKGLKQTLPQIVDGPLRVELGGKTIVVHHFIDWLKPDQLKGADVVITGHTHEIVNETRNRTLFLNPGECGGWVTDRATVAVLDTEGPSAQVIDLPD